MTPPYALLVYIKYLNALDMSLKKVAGTVLCYIARIKGKLLSQIILIKL